MTAKPKTRKAPAAETDPIFALIAEHKAREKEWLRRVNELENAEDEAAKTHGRRPRDYISWGTHFAGTEHEIDSYRRRFLGEAGADRKQIEKEYRDAKARLAAAERAGPEWDQRAGIAPLRKQHERASDADHKASMRVARTKPTTLAGEAALINYARRDLSGADWQIVALKTAAVALARIEASQ
jgi:hypothetical protein